MEGRGRNIRTDHKTKLEWAPTQSRGGREGRKRREGRSMVGREGLLGWL